MHPRCIRTPSPWVKQQGSMEGAVGRAACREGHCAACCAPGMGRAASPRQALHSYIFSWVSECLWLGCIAAIGDLENKNIHMFFLTAVCSFCSKVFLLPGRAPVWLPQLLP